MCAHRSREEVRAAFVAHGVTIAEWAGANGFSANLVYAVLLGKSRGTRGAVTPDRGRIGVEIIGFRRKSDAVA